MIDFAIEKLDKIGEKDAACAVGDLLFELRNTRRALWLSRARTARANCCFYVSLRDAGRFQKWKWVERKCREKAEEYR